MKMTVLNAYISHIFVPYWILVGAVKQKWKKHLVAAVTSGSTPHWQAGGHPAFPSIPQLL